MFRGHCISAPRTSCTILANNCSLGFTISSPYIRLSMASSAFCLIKDCNSMWRQWLRPLVAHRIPQEVITAKLQCKLSASAIYMPSPHSWMPFKHECWWFSDLFTFANLETADWLILEFLQYRLWSANVRCVLTSEWFLSTKWRLVCSKIYMTQHALIKCGTVSGLLCKATSSLHVIWLFQAVFCASLSHVYWFICGNPA